MRMDIKRFPRRVIIGTLDGARKKRWSGKEKSSTYPLLSLYGKASPCIVVSVLLFTVRCQLSNYGIHHPAGPRFCPSHRPTYWYPVAVSRKKASAMQVDHYAPVVWLLAFFAECTFWCRSTVRRYLGMLSTLVVRGPVPLSTIFTIRTVLVRLRTNYVLENKPEIVIFLSRETF